MVPEVCRPNKACPTRFCEAFLIQTLSAPNVDVANLTVDRFAPDAESLAVGRDALMLLESHEKLAIDDAPSDMLSDDFLVKATNKRVMSISMKVRGFRVGGGGGG